MADQLRSFEEATVEHFRNHPGEIAPYLDVALEESEKDGNWEAFLLALRIAVEATAGIGGGAEKLGRSRTSLYKTLSSRGNPRWATVEAILEQVGCRLSVQPRE